MDNPQKDDVGEAAVDNLVPEGGTGSPTIDFDSSRQKDAFLGGGGITASPTNGNLPGFSNDIARSILMKNIHSQEKVEERERFLVEHPESRIRVDTTKLKAIMAYEEFKCHPNSSVARDQAVRGSDIDVAVVITSEPTSLEQQMNFVQALRGQGFDVYHPQETELAKKELSDFSIGRGRQEDLERLHELTKRKVSSELNTIRFFTREELEKLDEEKPNNPAVLVSKGGVSIS